jgi:hypothetical protein
VIHTPTKGGKGRGSTVEGAVNYQGWAGSIYGNEKRDDS